MRYRFLIFFSLLLLLGGCAAQSSPAKDDTLHIVASAYPEYDFVRQTAGDHAEIVMLTRPGVDPHEYEPTPQSIIEIQNCDIFLYNGGESDVWVDELLKSVENDDMRIVRMMDCIPLLEEESVEGMESEHEENADEVEYDEHVWLSPVNVMAIAETLCDALTAADPANAAAYTENTAQFIASLEALDEQFREIVANAARTTVVFADRFPARYFTEAYGLTYYAAFPGCSAQTEPSAATVAFLIDKVREENIPCVLTVPFSTTTLPQTVSEATGAAVYCFDSFHNVGVDEFGKATYLDVMQANTEVLRHALND